MDFDVDEALAYLGKYSRWHILTYTFISIFTAFPTCWGVFSIVFIGIIPDYYCNVTDRRFIPVNKVSEITNETSLDRCHEYVDWTQSKEIQTCQNGYQYDTDLVSTIVTEWELVCEFEYLKDLSQMIAAVGVMMGIIFWTTLADRFGRKPIFLIANLGIMIGGTLTAVSPNFTFFVVLRFIMGSFGMGVMITGFVLACELFPADLRTIVGTMVQCIWGIAMMVMALMAYFIRNWRYFQLALSIPGVIIIFGHWCVPESIPWLVANGRRKEAEAILKRAAEFNNVDMPSHVFADEARNLREMIDHALVEKEEIKTKSEPEMEEMVKERPSVFFTHSRLRRYTFIMFCTWFVNAIVYYGLSLSTGDLAGNRYINFFISGVVEFFAYLHSIWVLEKFGRRVPLSVYHVIAAVGLIISILIPAKTDDGTSLQWLVIAFNMIGKFGISSSFSVIFLYAGEIIPVNVRGLGMGVCSVGSQLGSLIAPFSSTVTRQVYWLPAVVFGGMSITVGMMVLLLPETQHRVMPQRVTDLDTWDKKRGRAKSVDIHAMHGSRRSTRRSPDIRT